MIGFVEDRPSKPRSNGITTIVDGKQRVTSILRFMDGEFNVTGEWFEVQGMVRYPEITLSLQWRFKRQNLAVTFGALATIEDEREVFDLINFGGVAQGEIDPDLAAG